MKAIERRSSLIDAASKCFAARGYHATQVSDIIDEAEVARGTFYLYFQSKHGIFDQILDDFMKHLRAQILSIDLASEVSPADQMRRNVERVVDAVIETPEVGRILFNEAVGLDTEIDERLASFYRELIELISKSIQKGIDLTIVRPIDPNLAATIIIGSFREIFVQNQVFKNISIDRNGMVSGLIDVLMSGLCPNASIG